MVFATIKETVSHANGNKFHTEIYCSQICRKHIVVNSVQEFRRDLQAVSQKIWKHRAILAEMIAVVEVVVDQMADRPPSPVTAPDSPLWLLSEL